MTRTCSKKGKLKLTLNDLEDRKYIFNPDELKRDDVKRCLTLHPEITSKNETGKKNGKGKKNKKTGGKEKRPISDWNKFLKNVPPLFGRSPLFLTSLYRSFSF